MKRISLSGTSGRNAIPTYGGFNKSEFSIQHHKFYKAPQANYSEQERTHALLAGPNALNAPSSTANNTLRTGANKGQDYREQTLQVAPPAQVAFQPQELTASAQRSFSGVDASQFDRSVRHGWGQNDPSLQHLLERHQIAPQLRAHWSLQSDPYLHSDIGVPSSFRQNQMENPTMNKFPASKRMIPVVGQHDHTNLKEERTPHFHNQSNTSSGTHHTFGQPTHPVTNGFRATQDPLSRPLLLSDLPAPFTPMLRPNDEGPGRLQQTR